MPFAETGSETLVNSPPSGFNEGLPLVTGLTGGRYIVVWQSLDSDFSSDVRARIFNADGSPASSAFTIIADAPAFELPRHVAIEALPNGNFAIATYRPLSFNGAGQFLTNEIVLQIFGPTGAAVTSLISVSTVGSSSGGTFRTEPEISVSDDRLVVVWDSGGSFGTAIEARIFDLSGNPLSGTLVVEDGNQPSGANTVHYTAEAPDVAIGADGNFVAVWTDFRGMEGDSSLSGVRARMFDATGTPLADAFLVNTTTASYQMTPRAELLENGNFIVTWGDLSSGTVVLKAQLLSPSGAKIGGEIIIADTLSTETYNFHEYGITTTGSAGFAVTWADQGDDRVYVREFDVDGVALRSAALVSTNGGFLPAIGASADGGYVLAWGGSGGTIITQRFSFSPPLGGGDDILTGTEQADNLNGLGGNDTINALGGNDILDGGPGNDTLDGGAGADTMAGGTGNDRFYIDHAGDIVTEFASQGDDIAFVTGTYTLAQGVSIETLVALNQSSTDPLVLTGNEYGQSLYGNLGDNYLNGGQGADYLVGLAGNDNLLGGTGADHMAGGTGNDVYYVDQAGDLVTELGGEGEDLLVATASYVLGANASIETISAEQSSAAINLTGNELAQSMYGNAGNNILTGGGGADYMVGGAGNDRYYVDASDYIGEEIGGGDDWIFVASSYTLREGNEIETLVAVNQDSLAQVDFSGNEYGQSLYGSAGVNNLNGGGGNDYLVGLGGNDFLNGGTGNDHLAGGAGNDLYYVDGGDLITEATGEGDDLAVASESFALGSNQAVETLSAAEGSANINLTGNSLAQSLYGNAGTNILTTGGGNDYLVGGAGSDTFVISNAPGTATIADYAAGEAVDVTQWLSVAGGTDVIGGGYLRVTSGGQLQVDANGGGNGWTTIANVSGSSAVTIRYLSGGSATDLTVARSGQAQAMDSKMAADSYPFAFQFESGLGRDTLAGNLPFEPAFASHSLDIAPLALAPEMPGLV